MALGEVRKSVDGVPCSTVCGFVGSFLVIC